MESATKDAAAVQGRGMVVKDGLKIVSSDACHFCSVVRRIKKEDELK